MALHRDIFWVGRQWAVTGFGIQAIDQKRNGAFDITIAKIWDDGVVKSMRAHAWLNAEDFDKALGVARKRYPEPPRPAQPPPIERILPKLEPMPLAKPVTTTAEERPLALPPVEPMPPLPGLAPLTLSEHSLRPPLAPSLPPGETVESITPAPIAPPAAPLARPPEPPAAVSVVEPVLPTLTQGKPALALPELAPLALSERLPQPSPAPILAPGATVEPITPELIAPPVDRPPELPDAMPAAEAERPPRRPPLIARPIEHVVMARRSPPVAPEAKPVAQSQETVSSSPPNVVPSVGRMMALRVERAPAKFITPWRIRR